MKSSSSAFGTCIEVPRLYCAVLWLLCWVGTYTYHILSRYLGKYTAVRVRYPLTTLSALSAAAAADAVVFLLGKVVPTSTYL